MACKIIADDYGMSIEINNAISELVSKNIVSKISVMADEAFQYSLADIENAEKGLHFNLLSYEKKASINQRKNISPLKFLCFLYTKKIETDQIVDILNKQFNILVSKGFKISSFDTHQHIHIIPKLLKIIIMFTKTKRINSIRCITMKKKHLLFYVNCLRRFGFSTQIPKMILLYSAGAFMKLKLDKARINYCRNLVLMPLATGGDYSGLLKEILNRFNDEDAEIVTHPGLECKKIESDNYTAGRYIEYFSLLNLIGQNG